MLACEFAGQRVEIPHAFDGDEEGFIASQACLAEHCYLVAQVALQLLHVWAMDRPSAAQIQSPLRDLLFERRAVE